jgi:hypothetical protein
MIGTFQKITADENGSLMKEDPSHVINRAIEGFRKELKKDLDSEDRNEGWKVLMKADYMSARQFFRSYDISGIFDIGVYYAN